MARWCALAAVAAIVLGTSAASAPAQQHGSERLDAYTAVVDDDGLRLLAEEGFDVAPRAVPGGSEVDLVMTRRQRSSLARRGIRAKLTRVQGGSTVQQFAAAQAAGGFEVWRSWDEPGGLRDEMHELARSNPQIAKLVRIGTSRQGREILALKLTQGARGQADGRRPAVLFNATQHAREWIAAEVNRRLLRWYIDRWRADDRAVRQLLKETELWFVLVANPDGYEHSFDAERLWRKNLRDNDGDGRISSGDGVDLNRNFPTHFGYDEEGSSSMPAGETFRGPAAVSEPETRALKGLLDRIGFAFLVNWHSAGEWLLYADGWQIASPTADDPIYFALSGNLDRPAIPGFHPGLAADVLYVTNGETTDYAHASTGALAWTPELSEGCEGCGFVFPDDDELVQAEFERNLPFARSVAESAADPANPRSTTGTDTKPFYLRSDDPYKSGLPGANLAFEYSYGDPQPVQVLARRSLGAVTLRYRINGGPARSAPTSAPPAGERYAPPAVHYRELRGVVTGTEPGDTVEVWFEGGGQRSESFSYRAVSETGSRVLVVAAEDYTGASPVRPPDGPHHLHRYRDALAANGIAADVYDVDGRGRTAPDHVGVLGHYDAVVWYTGDDVVTRRAGWGPGNADRLAMDLMLEFRAYLNEGGRLLLTGAYAGQQYSGNLGTQRYDPKGGGPCLVGGRPATADPRQCLRLRGSGDGVNDVLQYWLGAHVPVLGDGHDPATGDHFDAAGTADPFAGLSWAFGGGDSADNQTSSSSFVATSGLLPVERFPQFRSWPSSRWQKSGGPFEPHSGDHYAFSQIADVSFKRLTREVAVPETGPQTLSFWTSYDTEADWDYLFVEARTAGGDDWTTLPDVNGHTSSATGESCPAGWRELHPQLDRYQTMDAATATCTPTGSSGEWFAATGNSHGWQKWDVDLFRWGGRTVEISISYVSDWSVQGLGVFLDDVVLPDGSTTSFEDGLGGWRVTGAPAGSAANANDWHRITAAGFPVGASITTPDTLLLGFGLEGVAGQPSRDALTGRAMGHLLR